MKRVLKQSAVASMVLAGIMAFTGTASAESGSVSATDAGVSSTEGSQEAPLEMSPQSYEDCSSGRLCFWTGKNATGSRFTYPRYSTGSCRRVHREFNNTASSVRNRTGHIVVLYDGNNCAGSSVLIFEWDYLSSLYQFDNRMSSFKFI